MMAHDPSISMLIENQRKVYERKIYNDRFVEAVICITNDTIWKKIECSAQSTNLDLV